MFAVVTEKRRFPEMGVAMKLSQTFPARLLGFGLYWAWLFLIAVSPSPVFGPVECLGLPFELCELFLRLVFIGSFFLLGEKVETTAGRAFLMAVCFFGGPLATVLLSFFHGTGLVIGAALAVSFVDASMFILWLCFFGHMRVGETALYMALSYCLGGVTCLGAQMLPSEAIVPVTAALPLASAIAFYLSNKMYANSEGKHELFSAAKRDVEEKPKPYPYLSRLGWALALYAFVFSLVSSSLYFGNALCLFPGPLVESGCCVLLAVVCGGSMFLTRQTSDLYLLYKAVPVVAVTGLVLMEASDQGFSTAGAVLVNLGYLMFEITALNDFCTASKTRNTSLVKTFCSARAAITLGLVGGWTLSSYLSHFHAGYALNGCAAAALLSVVVASTIVYTAKEVFAARNVSGDQAKRELLEDSLANAEAVFENDLARFADEHKLSSRETEIVRHLLRGRQANYIAEQLFIAPGTVKTHVHNIYNKVGVRKRMELLDSFDDFRKNS